MDGGSPLPRAIGMAHGAPQAIPPLRVVTSYTLDHAGKPPRIAPRASNVRMYATPLLDSMMIGGFKHPAGRAIDSTRADRVGA